MDTRSAIDDRDNKMLMRCIELSRLATREGENPFACVICEGDTIVAEATTRAARDGDITHHAELLAISEAQQKLGAKALSNCTIYCNVEPCAMCSYCIRETNIRRVVYCIPSPIMGGHSKWNILGDTDISDALPEVFHRPPEIVASALEREAEQVWREWHPIDWAVLRYRHAIGAEPSGEASIWDRLLSWARAGHLKKSH